MKDPTIFTVRTDLTDSYTIRVVNGEYIRNQNSDLLEFGLYAINNDFPDLIPENEIWVSERLPIGETGFIMEGCMTRLRALRQGKSDDDAYDLGVKKEASEREKHRGVVFESIDADPKQPIIDHTGYVIIPGDKQEDEVRVYLVDADMIRTSFKTDFLEGGNGAIYPWIPKNQIWIESDLNDREIPYVIVHEYVERLLMLEQGFGYDKAHELANIVELKRRKQGTLHQADLMALTRGILKELDFPAQENSEKQEKGGPLINTGWMREKPDLAYGDDLSSSSTKKLDTELTPQERACRVDLIWTEEKVKNCGNCQFIKDGYCYKPEVDLPIDSYGPVEKQCCIYWDQPGVKRVADMMSTDETKALSAINETTGGALVPPAACEQRDADSLLPPEEDRGQRNSVFPIRQAEQIGSQTTSLVSDPEGIKNVSVIRKKYRKRSIPKDGWITMRGCRIYVESGKVTKGPPGLMGMEFKDIPWAEEEDKYRGLRSLEKGWITIGGTACEEGEHCGGTPVYIDGEGKVQAGPENLEGRTLSRTPPPSQTQLEGTADKLRGRPKQSPPVSIESSSASNPSEAKKPAHSKAKISYLGEGQEKAVADLAGKILGKSNAVSLIPSLVGAPDDYKVVLRVQGHQIAVTVVGKDFTAARIIGKTHDGKKYVHNDLFEVRKESQGKGIGAEVFSKQVENCVEEGFSHIECIAAKSSRFNGYYTWPRLGYDQDLRGLDRQIQKDAKKNYPQAKTVLDIMESPGGREWWKQYGGEMSKAKFDLKRGSRSLRILNSYLEEKKAAGK